VNEQVYWYAARATGIVAWVLLTASVVWGLALSTRVAGKRPRAPWLLDMHRYLGGTAVIYTGLHMLSLWADSYVSFSPFDLFVPMASSWRPGAVAWGIAAMYVLLAVEVTSLLRNRIPTKLWRAVHVSSLGLLTAVWVHAFAAGSDMGLPAARVFAFGSVVVVLFLLVYRALSRMQLPGIARQAG
jgi:predicted ferric reductase